MARAWPIKYLRSTIISGTIARLDANAGAAANNSTIVGYNAGGTSTDRRFRPAARTIVANGAPSAPATPADDGWKENVPISTVFGDNFVTIAPHTFTAKLRYRRSGQSLEVDQRTEVTVILWRYLSMGLALELGRLTQILTFTTSVQSANFAITAAETDWEANEVIYIEVYVRTINAGGTPTPPSVATDLWLTLDEAAGTGAQVDPPDLVLTALGEAALSGSGALAVTGLMEALGSATLSGAGALTSSSLVEALAAASLSGSGALAVTANADVFAQASLSGDGALAAVGMGQVAGAASLTGSGALAASWRPDHICGQASLKGSGALGAAGTIDVFGAASLSAAGTLVGFGPSVVSQQVSPSTQVAGDIRGSVADADVGIGAAAGDSADGSSAGGSAEPGAASSDTR